MIAPICRHEQVKKHGKNRNGTQRVRCLQCGATWTVEAAPAKPKPLGIMRVPTEEAKQALWLLTEGASIRSTARITGLHRDTLCRLIVHFGRRCQQFLDHRMRGLTLDHLQFDEQWT